MSDSSEKTLWVFNHYAEEPSTGTGLRHYRLARQLALRGWKTVIFAASTVHQSDINLVEGDAPYVVRDVDGVTFVHVRARPYKGNGRRRILNILDYVKGCRRVAPLFSRPDAILASSVHPLSWGLGRRFSRRFRVPWVCEVRDLWPESLVAYGLIGRGSLAERALRFYEHRTYRDCDALVFVMEGGADYVKEQGWEKDVSASKTCWISNGIDLACFRDERMSFPYDDELLDEKGVFKLVYCGSMGDSDSLDEYLDAMKGLEERGISDVRLVLFGDGPRRAELERRCMDENIAGVFFRGRVKKRFIPSIVSRADANVISVKDTGVLRYGCSFNKLYDYLAAGRPIVSNSPLGKNAAVDSGCVFLAGGSDPSLCDAIVRLHAMPLKERADVGRKASALAEGYDFSVLAARLDETLKKAMDGAKGMKGDRL